jgi:pimeloyl-ACP methyl ester carboxylesterase
LRKEFFLLALVVVIALVAAIGFVSEEMRIASVNDEMISLQKQNRQLVVDAQVARGESSHAQEQANGLATRVATLETQLSAVRAERQWNTQTIFFQSDYDATRQSYLLLTPNVLSPTAQPLIVYFHSMGKGPDEVLNLSAGTELLASFLIDRKTIIVSPDYRGDSWLNPAAAADVTQMIRSLKLRYAISSIVVVGVSMGGTAALMYPLLAPSDISVSGMVATIYASDVKDLWSETKNTQVKESLRTAYGGTPSDQLRVYEERSVMRNIVRLPISMPVALYGSYNDSMIPTAQQTRLRDALAQRGNPLLFATIPGDHAVDDLSAGLAFVLNRMEKH